MSKITYSAMVKKMKVIWNPHADPDHHQKLITSRESPPCPCPPSLVDVRFRVRQLSCLQNGKQNDHITSVLLVEVKRHTQRAQTQPRLLHCLGQRSCTVEEKCGGALCQVTRKLSSSIRNSQAFPSADCGSDHQLVLANIKLKLKVL